MPDDYSFNAHVRGVQFDDSFIDALFDDTIGIQPFEVDDEIFLSVNIHADDDRQAIDRFLRFFSMRVPAGHIRRFDLDLVNIPEIALRADVSRETVRLWTSGERLTTFSFPKTFSIAGTVKLWSWSEVHAWLIASGRAVESPYDALPPSLPLLERANGMLARQRQTRELGWEDMIPLVATSNVTYLHRRRARPAACTVMAPGQLLAAQSYRG